MVTNRGTQSQTKRAALIVAASGSFVVPLMGSSVNVALPVIGREFHLDAVVLTWIATSYLLAAAAFLVPMGRLADIYGRKKIFLIGMTVFALSALLSALAVSAPMLIAFRICQGFGAAMIFSTGLAILSSVYPPRELGQALGLNVAVVYIGLSIGPFVGGLITEHVSWRGVFLLIVPICLATVGLTLVSLKGEWAEARGEKFDIVGSIIYGIALVAFMCGLSAVPAWESVPLILVGVCGALAFVSWEMRVQSPVFDVSLFRSNRTFAFSSLAALLHYGATFAVTFLLSIFLQHVQGFSPQRAGLVLVVQPSVMAVFSPLAGRISDRIEPRIVASIGMGLTALGLLFLGLLGEHASLTQIIASLAVLGLGFALFSSPNANAIMSSVERRLYGTASGSVGTMRLLGQMLSMGIATLIFAVVIGRVEITDGHHALLLTSLHWAFFLFAGISVPGILLSLTRGEVHRKPDSGALDG